LKKIILASAFATATAASIFVASPVKAACTSSNSANNCVTFDPSSASSVVYAGYNDGGFTANDRLTDISFYSNNITSGFDITLTNIAYSLDGTNFITTGLSSTSYTLTANGVAGSGTNLLAPFNIGSPIGSNFKLRFEIPAISGFTPTDGTAAIAAYVRNQKSSGPALPQTQTRDSAAYIAPTSAGVPGPLPLIGAAAAFGFSRKLRRRISIAA
jgi:hypothetical protein